MIKKTITTLGIVCAFSIFAGCGIARYADTPIGNAAKTGDVTELDAAIRAGKIAINDPQPVWAGDDSIQKTPLCVLAERVGWPNVHDPVPTIDYLLEHGVDVNGSCGKIDYGTGFVPVDNALGVIYVSLRHQRLLLEQGKEASMSLHTVYAMADKLIQYGARPARGSALELQLGAHDRNFDQSPFTFAEFQHLTSDGAAQMAKQLASYNAWKAEQDRKVDEQNKAVLGALANVAVSSFVSTQALGGVPSAITNPLGTSGASLGAGLGAISGGNIITDTQKAVQLGMTLGRAAQNANTTNASGDVSAVPSRATPNTTTVNQTPPPTIAPPSRELSTEPSSAKPTAVAAKRRPSGTVVVDQGGRDTTLAVTTTLLPNIDGFDIELCGKTFKLFGEADDKARTFSCSNGAVGTGTYVDGGETGEFKWGYALEADGSKVRVKTYQDWGDPQHPTSQRAAVQILYHYTKGPKAGKGFSTLMGAQDGSKYLYMFPDYFAL